MKRKLKELMNRALRKEEGFTLVEIIVVIVIMAILAAIAVPSVLSYINDANDAKYVAEARAIYLAIQVEETKYNATSTADGTALANVDSTKTGETDAGKIIFDNVKTRIAKDSSGLAVTSATYATAGTPAIGTYTIGFTSADKSTQTATVTANDEVKITAK